MTDDFELPFPQYRCPSCGRDLPLNEARLTVTCAEHQPEAELAFVVREAKAADKHDIEEICDRAYGETEIDVFGQTFDVLTNINLIASTDSQLCGLMSLAINRGDLVVVMLSVYPEFQGQGVGSALLGAACSYGTQHGITSIRCGVSNDDIPLLYFYQRHGFSIEDVAVGHLVDTTGSAVAGFSGILSRDEIRLRRSVCP